MTTATKTNELTTGTEVYYTGDMANSDGFGRIVAVLPSDRYGPERYVIHMDEDDDRVMTVYAASFRARPRSSLLGSQRMASCPREADGGDGSLVGTTKGRCVMAAMNNLLLTVADELNVDPYDDDGNLDPLVAAEAGRRIGAATEPTPGPWIVNGGQIEADGVVVATVGVVNEQSRTDTANARLIAAAPELLAACERLTHWIRDPIIAEAIGDECGVWLVVDEVRKCCAGLRNIERKDGGR